MTLREEASIFGTEEVIQFLTKHDLLRGNVIAVSHP